MRAFCIAQGTLFNVLWYPKWEGNPRKGDMCTCVVDSLCYTAETNATLQSNHTPIKLILENCKQNKIKAKKPTEDQGREKENGWNQNHQLLFLPFFCA